MTSWVVQKQLQLTRKLSILKRFVFGGLSFILVFMPHIVLFSPLVDIVLISLLFNVFAYVAYARLYGREFNKIASVDLRLSIAELLLVIANYANSGTVVTVWGQEFSWVWWYVIISIPLEIIFFFAYKWYFSLSWTDISGG